MHNVFAAGIDSEMFPGMCAGLDKFSERPLGADSLLLELPGRCGPGAVARRSKVTRQTAIEIKVNVFHMNRLLCLFAACTSSFSRRKASIPVSKLRSLDASMFTGDKLLYCTKLANK